MVLIEDIPMGQAELLTALLAPAQKQDANQERD
jgi:hypothetical protein